MSKALAVVILGSLFLLAACAGAPPSSSPTPTPTLAVAGVNTQAPTYEADYGAIPTPVDPAVREALRRITLPGGIEEVVPGFGGFRLDGDIAIVLMDDPTQRELAEEAARLMLGSDRFEREIREVRVLPAQYTIGQLGAWYAQLNSPVSGIEGLISTDLNEGVNRLQYHFKARPGVRQEVEALLDSLGVPREAVIIEVGCDGVGQPWTRPSPPRDPMRQSLGALLERSLKVTLEAPSHVKPGEAVPLTLTVKNISNEPVSSETGVALADFVVTGLDGDMVWGTICESGVRFLSAHLFTLAPGEEMKVPGLWRQWDGQGEPVPNGDYLAYGIFNTYPEMVSAPVTIER